MRTQKLFNLAPALLLVFSAIPTRAQVDPLGAGEAKEYFHACKLRANARACLANMKTYAGAGEMYRLDKSSEPPTSTVDERKTVLAAGGYLPNSMQTFCPADKSASYEIGPYSRGGTLMDVRCKIHGTPDDFRLPKFPYSREQEARMLETNPMVRTLRPAGESGSARDKSADKLCQAVARAVENALRDCVKSGGCTVGEGAGFDFGQLAAKGYFGSNDQISCPLDDKPFTLTTDKSRRGVGALRVNCLNHPSKWH